MVKRVSHTRRLFSGMFVFLLLFLTGLALTRLLYEAAFPRLLWLSQPLPVLICALIFAVIGRLVWRVNNSKFEDKAGKSTTNAISVWTLTPLLLNLLYLFNPGVDLVGSRFIFGASIWLTALFIASTRASNRNWGRLGILFIAFALLPLYLMAMPQAVGRADTFEFQVVIPQMGIAHPTGYPLYIILGKLFTFIPFGSVAWRINLASAVFTFLAVSLLYLTALRLLKRPVPALLAAVLLGLTAVIWSQAIEAEVYALHALFVATSLWLMVVMVNSASEVRKCTQSILAWPPGSDWQRLVLMMALLLGLGLTNHLTTLFLLPPALLAILLTYGSCLGQQTWQENLRLFLKALAAFLLPLLLYAYLPLRWFALHDEPMGLARFVDWVIGGRFQGALQLAAWITDGTRYEVVGRLLLHNWGGLNLSLAALGLLYLLLCKWRIALILLLTWLGFIFYALNYFVPDLAVFIIPAHLVTALFWAAGLTAILALINSLLLRLQKQAWQIPLEIVVLLLLLLPSLRQIADQWPAAHDDEEKLLTWGKGVLALPLDENAAILADSEKIAPLYYLQQAEGERPDLEIMVLPDEAAYRSELDARVGSGQTVYLARFLPGLEGVYHLRSFGPLIEVSSQPLTALPEEATTVQQTFGPLLLAGYSLQEPAMTDPLSTAVTLFWEAAAQTQEPQYVYVRWSGDGSAFDPDVKTGQHPAANYYPVGAWRKGEIVPDFHLLPRPITAVNQTLDLQVAIGPPFSQADNLDWQTITQMTMPPSTEIKLDQTLRAQNGRVLLSGLEFPPEIRPQTPLPVMFSGYGHDAQVLRFSLEPLEPALAEGEQDAPMVVTGGSLPAFVHMVDVDTDLPNGRYRLLSKDLQAASTCGWLAQPSSGCVLGEVQISGVPLPEGATNYEDKIALLGIELPDRQLQPGGQLPVNLRWQSLSPLDKDYTIFLQVLNAQDQIVGQVDAWPLHGTYATSQWKPGEIIDDPHLIPLDSVLPPGPYRLQVGWYLLSTLRRLPVLNDDGLPVDDKIIVTDLAAP